MKQFFLNLWAKRFLVLPVLGVLTVAMAAGAANAQTPVPTLAIDSTVLQTNLFTGANIILVGLGAVFFMLIGFGFGGKILRAIGDFIQRFSF